MQNHDVFFYLNAHVLTEKYNGKQTALIKHKKVYEHDAWLSKHM